MVDGTGMCGCCRVVVGGQTKFACVDGLISMRIRWTGFAGGAPAHLSGRRKTGNGKLAVPVRQTFLVWNMEDYHR